MRFETYAEKYLERKREKARRTYLQAEYILRAHLLPVFAKREITEITEFEVEEYLIAKKRKYKIYDHKKHLKGIFYLARKMGAKVPPLDMKVFDTFLGRGKLYSRSEIVKLLWGARRNKNLRLQIYMMVVTGMRVSETLALHRKYCRTKATLLEKKNMSVDIVWIYLPPHAQKVKSIISRDFPCNVQLSRILQARFRRLNGDWLFPKGQYGHQVSNNTEWQRLKRATGVSGRIHDLRHTSCSQKLSVGFPEAFIKKTHAMSRPIIDRYTHVPERDAVHAAINGLRMAS
jgi:integrase